MNAMAIQPEEPRQVLLPKMQKAGLLFAGGVVVCLFGLCAATGAPFRIQGLSATNRAIVGVIGMAFFGPVTLVLAWALVRRMPRLELTKEALRIVHLRGSHRYEWVSVSAFTVRARRVGFDLSPASQEFRALRRFNRRAFGSEAQIDPYVYGMSAHEMATLLNSWRDRTVDAPPN